MALTDNEREALALALVRTNTDEDGLFYDTIEQVKRMFYAGELSAPDAADLLNLSLTEFVDEFIVTDEWCQSRGATSSDARQAVVDEVTTILQRECSGISVRDFVAELLETVPALRAQPGFDVALDEVPNQPLGHLLRLEQASGTSVDEFVALSLLPTTLRQGFEFSDADWTSLAAEGVRMLVKREEYVWNALWFSALQPSVESVRQRLLSRLEHALASKHMAIASKLIARIDTGRALVAMNEPGAARLLWCYTRYIPYNGRYLPRVEESLKRYSQVAQTVMDPVDRARLTIVEGVTLFYREQYEASRKCLVAGEDLARSIGNCETLLVWCLYFQAKIHWKDGLFDKALTQVLAATSTGEGIITEAERATLDLFRAWLLFLLKNPSAKVVLKRADDVLRRTDCHLRRGDVLSARGRLALADGDYVRAQRLFTRAISSYAHHDSVHRHVARALVNQPRLLQLGLRLQW
jgi:tetratricopeptide (TPR) repeat protein